MTLPNFLIIGAGRAGTTSVYHCLRQHPDVFMSPIKERNFFEEREGLYSEEGSSLRQRSYLGPRKLWRELISLYRRTSPACSNGSDPTPGPG